MPLYEYECSKCGNTFEKLEKFSDEPLKKHQGCGGKVHRLISAPGLQFKGSGWYITDYARSGSGGGKSEGGESGASGSKDSSKESSGSASGSKDSDGSTKSSSGSDSSPGSSSSSSSSSPSGKKSKDS